ncbi:MAG: pinensin family lanthipeptide [Ignavibacteria bacterium]|jgi:hypothetical protein
MKKLKLNLEDLKVESFEISKSRNTLGTIKGQAEGSHTVPAECDSVDYLSCEAPTCDCNGTMVICTCPADTLHNTCEGQGYTCEPEDPC